MFISYDLAYFGRELNRLRKDMGYSQSYVQKKVGVNVDTIRKIENGEVKPRYETLELLSLAYKFDLLELLKSCRSNKHLVDYHDELDYITANYHKDKLIELEKSIHDNFSSKTGVSLVNIHELTQFKVFISSIRKFHSSFSIEWDAAELDLIRSLRLTIPNFNIKKYKDYKYSYIEIRILFLISLLIAENHSNYEISIEILTFILDSLMNDVTNTKYKDFLIIKVYSNIAYNFHMLDEHQKVIETSNAGINFCINKQTHHSLYSLFYRKGIAQFSLGYKGYMESLKTAIFLLKLEGFNDLYMQYIEITKKKYGIFIPKV
ncbi:helix-turn-helix transcriptional regulator [Alkalicella caledoniensis]|uniref:Helix-turn-helix transcriptional regulator n=1 Tax=Alkalicella caledoniensis TaxID=2731377 RepID=A0A7G9WA42_ALKCA|nr:helix-turn-helix transcriptional regulator [Alkalicella caledoniensis]QNO15554.1 helix-turn-helix transcriptional regulator [Alkalicella caledoniensis]